MAANGTTDRPGHRVARGGLALGRGPAYTSARKLRPAVMRKQWSAIGILSVLAACNAQPEEMMLPDGGKPPQRQPENVVGGFSAQIPSQTVEPGTEVTPCW